LNPEEFFRKAGLKPRPLQLQAAKQLAEMIDTGSVGFQAPTGFGKTITVLAAISLADAFPATWRVRTFDIAKRVSDDCALLGLPFFIGAGREKLCPLKTEYKNNTVYFCRYLKHKCSFFRELSKRVISREFFEDVFNYEDLSNKVEHIEVCPYYLQSFIDRKVFIVPYRFGLPLNVNLEVVDEAHNLVLDLQSFPEEKLREALAELDLKEPIEDLIGSTLVETAQMRLVELLEMGRRPLVAGSVLSLLQGAKFIWREEGVVNVLKFNPPRGRTIFVSATLEPLAKIFKIPLVKVPVERKPVAFILSWLTTRFRDFDAYMIKQYNDLIFLLRKNFERILVFATKRISRHLVADFVEGAPQDWKGVLILYSRGRKSEGVNIESEAVVIAGAPYLPPYVHVERIGITHDETVAVITIQNIGRAIRQPENNPLIVLADERYLKLKQFLSDYFHFVEVNDLQELDRLLKRKQYSSEVLREKF